MMRLVDVSMRKDLSRHARDPVALALWVGIPLVVGFLITLAFGDAGSAPPRAKLLVVDQDDTFASAVLKGLLAREELRVLDTEVVSLEDGQTRISQGDGSALFIIPAGFQAGVLQDEPTKLELITNPAQSVLPKMAEQLLGTLTDLVFYAQRIIGDELRRIADATGGMGTAPEDETVAQISKAVNGVIRRAESYLFPPAVGIETSVEEGGDRPNFAVLFLPGIVLMALFFLAGGVSEDMWRERSLGTIRRAVRAPSGVAPLFAGKILAGMLLSAIVSLVLLVLGMWYLELPFSVLPLAVLWCVATAGILLVVLCFVQTFASTQRAGQVLVNAITFPLLMLGGSFFPSEMMPKFLSAIGRYTPNGWSSEYLKDMLLERGSQSQLWGGLLLFIVLGLVLFFVTTYRVKQFARAS